MMEHFTGLALFFLGMSLILLTFSQYWFHLALRNFLRLMGLSLTFPFLIFDHPGLLLGALLFQFSFLSSFFKHQKKRTWFWSISATVGILGISAFLLWNQPALKGSLTAAVMIGHWSILVFHLRQKRFSKDLDHAFLDISIGLFFSVLFLRLFISLAAMEALTLAVLLVLLAAVFFFMERKIKDMRSLNLKYREKLLHSEKEYLKIFENSPAMYLLLDSDFKILDCNRKFIEAVGVPLESVLGSFLEFFVPEIFKNKLRLLHNYLKYHKASSGEFAIINENKKDTIDVFLSGMKEEENTFIIMQDITVIKWMQNSLSGYAEQLKKEMEHAKVADRMKSVFLANMSHEIRTPLTSIIGFSSLLKETDLAATQKDYVEKVIASGEHLLKIINDIIDLSKIEAGKMDIEFEKVNLNKLFCEIHDMVYPQLMGKPVEFRILMEEEFQERYVLLDGFRLKQIIINLVSNAVKFTEKGSIELKVFSEQDRVVFSVKDTGIGIPPEKHEMIFDAFVQAEDSLHRVYGGTGLGLAISKRLVELMGGMIALSSEEKQGTLIRVSFPDTVLNEPIPVMVNQKIKEELSMKQAKKLTENNSPEESIKGFSLPSLLIAEDNESVYLLLDFVLRKNQIQMVRAKDGEEALTLYEKHHAHLKVLLLDINLPKLTGLEIAAKIKAQNQTVKILGFSAYSYDEIKDKAQNLLDGYIKKPFKINEIYDLLKDYL